MQESIKYLLDETRLPRTWYNIAADLPTSPPPMLDPATRIPVTSDQLLPLFPEAVVAQERETAAKPVPDKVMDDMRTCQAAVIHVSAEGIWTDAEGKEQPHINPNVLIEIGAAMALYSKRFILLVEEGVKLPSNLQGLYECRYKGDELSLDGAMKLAEALDTLR